MSEKLSVTEDTSLLPFLFERLQGWSRTKVKERLQSGLVVVNGQAVTKHSTVLVPGDVVEVLATAKHSAHAKEMLEILYADRDLVAVNKPAGLLSVGTERETKQHALAMLRKQLSTPRRTVQPCPVNRLDRDTSGVLLFAMSRPTREVVMKTWDSAEKIYLAIIQGKLNPPRGTIDQPLRYDVEERRSLVGNHPDAQSAITHYSTESSGKYRSLLKLQIVTGRQHQIRAHLAWLGYPVIGDGIYGIKGPHLGLHSLRLSITHPKTGKPLVIEAPPPEEFLSEAGPELMKRS